MYIEKDQECWTAAANSKTETVFRRSSTSLYEKDGKSNIVVMVVYQELCTTCLKDKNPLAQLAHQTRDVSVLKGPYYTQSHICIFSYWTPVE